ncbi:MAG: hypothetical protein C4522_14525 [Desulfobacteraceae bacterium]|nr:MAG: hypothetical protein C4522_14525 [Desulfobacteraceae bacterium]
MQKTVFSITMLLLFSLVVSFSSADAADYLPDQVRSKIQSQAKERYPGNEVLQQRLISLQTKAYFKVQEYRNELITDQEMNVIKGQAARKFPDNFVSQLTFIDKQSKKFPADKVDNIQR